MNWKNWRPRSRVSSPNGQRSRLLVVAGALLASTTCGEAEPMRVGFAVPPHWYRAVRLALEDHPDAPVTPVWDTLPGIEGGASGALYWAEWHVAQRVDVVVGHDASRPAVAAGGIYNREGILQVAPVVTSALLEAQGPWSIALVPNGAAEGRFIAAFADSVLGARRVALMYNNDEFGHDLRDGVSAELAARGMEVVDRRFFDPDLAGSAARTGLDPVFTAALGKRPEVIVFAGRELDLALLMQFRRRQGDTTPVIASDAATIRAPGRRRFEPVLDGAYLVRLVDPTTEAGPAFRARFAARWGEPPDDAELFVYDAATLILAAADDGATTAAAVRGWLRGLGRDRPPFAGVAGTYAFQDGRPFAPTLGMYRIVDGQAVRVEPRS